MWNSPSFTSYGSPGGFVREIVTRLGPVTLLHIVFSDGGVSRMVLDDSGGAYLAGITGGGVGVTPSAPQPCVAGGEDNFVTHLDPHGALLDRSYFDPTGSYAYASAVGLALSDSRAIRLVL